MADESEEACLVNPKSPLNCGQMPYTDGIGVNSTSATSTAAGSHSYPQAQATATTTTTAHHTGHNTTITANSYDINDDIILSQFHADAIKQASCISYVMYIHIELNWFIVTTTNQLTNL